MGLVGMAVSSSNGPASNEGDRSSGEQTQFETQPATDGDAAGGSSGQTVDPPTVTISSDRGDINVRFDPDGVARVSTTDRSGEFDLVPGTSSGVRLNEEGQLEPVPPAEIGEDDIGLTPSPEGVDVIAPGSPLVELRPDGELGGVSATEFDGEEARSLTPSSGEVTLDDGTTINPIEPPGEGFSIVAAESGPMPWTWIFAAIAILTVVSATTGYLLHRNRPDEVSSSPVFDGTTRVDEDFEQFLKRLAADPDPTRAIRLGFHAIEQGVGGLPIRREEETPFEWHRRTADTMPAVEQPLGAICDLFAKVRFAPGEASPADCDHMIDQLRQLLHVAHTPPPADPAAALSGQS
jgi:hypothetical protein